MTPNRLDSESILDAAQAVADRLGGRGLTMRAVGAELDADPTAIYRHFRSKSELMVALADRMFAGMLDGQPDPDWRQALRDSMLHGRRIYQEHPAFAEVLAVTPDDVPSLERAAERVIGLLRRAGLSDRDAAWFYHLIVNQVAGTGIFHALADDLLDPEACAANRRVYATLPPDRFPNCTAVAEHLYPDADAVYELGVELLIEAVQRRAAINDHEKGI